MLSKASLSLLLIVSRSLFTAPSPWVQERMRAMSMREKIGQLFVVAVSTAEHGHEILASQETVMFPPMSPSHVAQLVKKYHVGGIIFLRKQKLADQVQVTNELQRRSKLPLLVVEDLEWGLAMRIEHMMKFPKNLTLGAIADEQLLYDLGKEIGRQCKLIGVHMNLAPVVDINTNPENPVIHMRSFGDDKEKVTHCGLLVMQGMQDAGILACAKHFPGHGDTDIDSHVALPRVTHSRQRLWREELYPFRTLIHGGVDAIMTAHLQIPALDKKYISTLSHHMVTGLLRNKLGFDGLVVTDGLNMGALSGIEPGKLELQALLAGHDILLIPRSLEKAVAAIENALIDGTLSEDELDAHVSRILQAKERLGLHKKRIVSEKDLKEKIDTPNARSLKKKLYQQAMTVVYNDGVLPLDSESRVYIIQSGGKKLEPCMRKLQGSTDALVVHLPAGMITKYALLQAKKMGAGDVCIVGVFSMNGSAKKKFGITHDTIQFVRTLQEKGCKVIVTLFGTPYSAALFPDVDALLVAYEDDPDAQDAAADIILGDLEASGILPVQM